MKVLHLPNAVSGIPFNLANGERELGIDSRVFCREESIYNYNCDENLHLERKSLKVIKLAALLKKFLSIRNSYNVFHFNQGSSLVHSSNFIFPHLELPFYPKKSRLFVTYYGCDARQKYLTMKIKSLSACHDSMCYGGICNNRKRDIYRKRAIEKMSKYVRHIWAVNPDLLEFLPKDKSSFLPYPIKPIDKVLEKCSFEKKKLKIVHAPTDRNAKGTKYILEAIEKLNKNYRNHFDFQLVENYDHLKTISVIKSCDIVIDQLLIGWYGVVSIEAMSIGKPAICRIENNDFKNIPPQMAQDILDSFIFTDRFNLEETLKKCIEDRNYLKCKSEASIEFSKKWHDPKFVASITKAEYLKTF